MVTVWQPDVREHTYTCNVHNEEPMSKQYHSTLDYYSRLALIRTPLVQALANLDEL